MGGWGPRVEPEDGVGAHGAPSAELGLGCMVTPRQRGSSSNHPAAHKTLTFGLEGARVSRAGRCKPGLIEPRHGGLDRRSGTTHKKQHKKQHTGRELERVHELGGIEAYKGGLA